MSKLNFAVYPAVALVSLVAAFSVHAQSANDPADQAAYGAMAAAPAAGTGAKSALTSVSSVLVANRSVREFDPVDRAGYGPMVANTASVRTRAEVRAEAIAARAAGYDVNYREGGDAGFAYAAAAKPADTARVVAGSIAKNVK